MFEITAVLINEQLLEEKGTSGSTSTILPRSGSSKALRELIAYARAYACENIGAVGRGQTLLLILD